MELFKKKLILAPMAGITESVFRTLCKNSGADIVYSEMVSAEGVYYSGQKTLSLLTFKNLNNWLTTYNEALQENKQEIPAILVGSKIDLQDRRTVSLENAIAYSNENNFTKYLECSSKTGANVELVFQTLGRIIVDKLNLLKQLV